MKNIEIINGCTSGFQVRINKKNIEDLPEEELKLFLIGLISTKENILQENDYFVKEIIETFIRNNNNYNLIEEDSDTCDQCGDSYSYLKFQTKE